MTDRRLLEGPAPEVAPTLLGWRLVTNVDGVETAIRLIEVEAYSPDDPASHSHRGQTERNRSMFRRAGTLYVYRSYGIHWCANVVTGPPGHGAAILVRAGIVLSGEAAMRERRGRRDHLVDGPGKLCQALAITGEHDGIDLLADGPIRLVPGRSTGAVRATPRIGITRATDRHWRFLSEASSGRGPGAGDPAG